MKNLINLKLSVLIFTLVGINSADAAEYIIKLKPNQKLTGKISKSSSSREINTSFGSFLKIVTKGKGKVASSILNDPAIEAIEPNYNYQIIKPIASSANIDASGIFSASNDPRQNEQWALGAIRASRAWEIETGSREVVVAIIDSGITYDHEDLSENIWENIAERDGVEGQDDDGNGLIDDIYGYDFAYGDGDPRDGNGHGSHCAGIIGAVHNNGFGIKGVNAEVRLMGIQMGYSTGGSTTEKILNAINYAVEKNVDVMNNSWGGLDRSQFIEDAIRAAGDKGIIFVAAAGNNKENIDSKPFYPASYKLDNIIVVAANNKANKRASFSNWGKNTVTIFAPGRDILSTVNWTNWRPYWYRFSSGTSMAAPYVTGAIAMLIAKEGRLSGPEIKARLIRTSRRAGGLSGLAQGGILDLPKFILGIYPEGGATVRISP